MAYCNSWCRSQADQKYHDTEWGRPLHEDHKQFEFLMLEVMQCGLSWRLILKKRAVFRQCFDKFNYEKISRYTAVNIKKILNVPGMIKSERKIKAVIQNANAFLKVRKEFGSFSAFLWDFCGGKTIVYSGHATGKVPAANGLSVRLSRELKKRGFAFLGPVTVYSHLQACGVINDHSKTCPLFAEISKHYPTVKCPRDQEI